MCNLAGQNMALMKCAGINGTGPARTLMAMDLLKALTKVHTRIYHRLILS